MVCNLYYCSTRRVGNLDNGVVELLDGSGAVLMHTERLLAAAGCHVARATLRVTRGSAVSIASFGLAASMASGTMVQRDDVMAQASIILNGIFHQLSSPPALQMRSARPTPTTRPIRMCDVSTAGPIAELTGYNTWTLCISSKRSLV